MYLLSFQIYFTFHFLQFHFVFVFISIGPLSMIHCPHLYILISFVLILISIPVLFISMPLLFISIHHLILFVSLFTFPFYPYDHLFSHLYSVPRVYLIHTFIVLSFFIVLFYFCVFWSPSLIYLLHVFIYVYIFIYIFLCIPIPIQCLISYTHPCFISGFYVMFLSYIMSSTTLHFISIIISILIFIFLSNWFHIWFLLYPKQISHSENPKCIFILCYSYSNFIPDLSYPIVLFISLSFHSFH